MERRMRRVHLAWIIPLAVAFGAGVASLVFLFARAFTDNNVQFYFNDALIRTEMQIMWHDIAGIIIVTALGAVGAFTMAIGYLCHLLVSAKRKLEAKIEAMQAQRAPGVKVERAR